MKKLKEKITLETQRAYMGQYGDESEDIFDEFEAIVEHHERYAKSIGTLMISFSELENSVDIELATAISERAYEPGYRIIKYLEFRDKINLWRDHYSAYIKGVLSDKTEKRFLIELKIIYLKLVELSEFRNKIAHANWSSLNKAGFVIYRSVENKAEAGMSFEKIKMTPSVIIKFIRQNKAVAIRINEFRENFWSVMHREDVKRYRKQQKKKVGKSTDS